MNIYLGFLMTTFRLHDDMALVIIRKNLLLIY